MCSHTIYSAQTLQNNVFFLTDVNECSDGEWNNCHQNADCINTIGYYMCTCKHGYSGDGRNCTGEMLTVLLLMHGVGSVL